jgi:hypothetical protein
VEPTQEILANAEVLAHVEVVKILTKNLGVYTAEDLRHHNEAHLHIGPKVQSSSPLRQSDSLDIRDVTVPPFVSKYIAKLGSKRPVSQVRINAG